MAEPTVQVPVSRIERARAVVESEVDETWVFRAQEALRALLSQPSPSAEQACACGHPEFDHGHSEGDGCLHCPCKEFATTPPRIQDMVPGTTFTAVDPGRLGDRATFEVLNNHRGRNVETWVHWAPSSFISSTIRNVTVPKEPAA